MMARAGPARDPALPAPPGPPSPPLGQRPLPGLLEPVMAEGALFHNALGTHRNVGVLTRGVLLVPVPVEVLRVVRAAGHAEGGADTAGVDLRPDPVPGRAR